MRMRSSAGRLGFGVVCKKAISPRSGQLHRPGHPNDIGAGGGLVVSFSRVWRSRAAGCPLEFFVLAAFHSWKDRFLTAGKSRGGEAP